MTPIEAMTFFMFWLTRCKQAAWLIVHRSSSIVHPCSLFHIQRLAGILHRQLLEHLGELATWVEAHLLLADGRAVALIERLGALRREHWLERAERAQRNPA